MKSTLRSLFRFCCNLIDSPALILLYHRVTNLPLDPQLLTVSPANFDEHLKFLNKNYNLIDLQEFADCLINKRKLPKRSVLLTFDDGYADNYLEALPLLENNKAQALFYISTSIPPMNSGGIIWNAFFSLIDCCRLN
jgi:peptidoglycan/xylan/chitin deacetylase (PgdA/CDA1 family)